VFENENKNRKPAELVAASGNTRPGAQALGAVV